MLFSHNTLVGIMTFGLGMAAGVPTIMLSVYQGLPLGAFIALHYNRELTVDFLGWLAIHGVTELGALVLFAAGGLVIAEKILFPGRYSRIENLALHGRLAAQMAVGAVLMLFVAAILEGGFRQLVRARRCASRSGSASARSGSPISATPERGRRGDDADPRAHVGILRRRAARAGARSSRRKGCPLPVELADHGERLIAFVIDLFIWLLLTLAIYIPIIWAIGSSGGSLIAISIALFIGFLVRNLYFVYFELAWRGSTPGKRLVGLARDRSRRRPVAAGRRRRAQPHARGRDVLPLGMLMTWGGGRRRRGLGEACGRACGSCSSRRCRSSTATACAAAT